MSDAAPGEAAYKAPAGVCPICEKPVTTSALTDSNLILGDRDAALAYGGATMKPLVYASGGYLHLHGVMIAPIGALTVRWAVRNWWQERRRRIQRVIFRAR